MKKLLILIMCMLLLVAPLISSAGLTSIDDFKIYDKSISTYNLKNFFGLGKTISTLELKTPQNYEVGLGYQKVAEINIINGEYDYEEIIRGIELYNIRDGMKEIVRDIDYKYQVTIQVPNYIQSCEDVLSLNGTLSKVCVSIEKGTRDKVVWEDFTKNSLKIGEKITLGLFTTTKEGDHIEWILNVYGNERLVEWATWDASLEVGLRNYFSFNKIDGNIVIDYMQNSNGTKIGSNGEFVAGKIEDGYNVTADDSGGDYINVTSNFSKLSDDGSICFWINLPSSTPTGGWVYGEWSGNILIDFCGTGSGCDAEDVGRARVLSFGAGVTMIGTTYINTTTWNHICFTRNVGDNNASLYVNGVVEATTTQDNTPTIGTGDLRIMSGGGSSVIGNIDEWGMWNRTLSASEVSTLYASGGGITPQEKVTLNSPADTTNTTNTTINFNGTISDITPANVSLIIDDTYNETNTSGILGDYLFTKILSVNSHTWNYESCTTTECYNGTQRSLTIVDYLEHSYTFNSTTAETKSEKFYINITTNGSIPTSGELIYNGTTYSATITNTVGNDYNISKTIDIPLVNESKPFYFNFTLLGTERSTTTQNQTVNLTVFTLCNVTYADDFLNISFKDEGDNVVINASIPTSNFVYYLGSGSVTKTYTYVNASDNYNYRFCATPALALNVDSYIQYKQGSAYPQRVYDPDATSYNNTLTDKILYLLGVSDGIYVTFQVVNSATQPISDVEVIATREISGTDTIVGQGTTGADGGVTLWLNPDFIHDFSFAKTGFTTYETSFAPTQTAYTITLSGGTTITSSYFKGIDFSILPINSSLINDTIYTFGFNLTSSFWDLDEYGFDLRLTNGTTITGGSTSTSGTPLTLNYNTTNQTKIYLDYYWIINSTTTSGIRVWVVYNTEYTQWSIATFFTDLTLYLDSGFFGIDNFGRSFLIFIVIFFTAGIVSYKFGFTSPVAVSTTVFLTVFFLETILKIIPPYVLPSGYELPSVLSFITGLILIMVIFHEVRR